MATPARCSLLALVCLALVHLLACAPTTEELLVRSPMDTTTLPWHALVLPLVPDEPTTPTGCPASSNRLGASPSASTFSGAVLQQRLYDASVIAHGDNATAPTTTTATATAPTTPSSRVCCVHHTREAAAVDGSLRTPGASGITAPSKMAAVLKALPLLTIPFLPPPVAALVAISSLASPVSARSDDCFKLNHATCTRPNRDLDLGSVCLHPLCHADPTERLFSVLNGQRHGRWDWDWDDILHIYCIVSTLEGDLSILPWRNTWRVHLPVADPGAAAASSANICYVEEVIAAAVWEHRRLNYRATAGPRYATYQHKYKHDEF